METAPRGPESTDEIRFLEGRIANPVSKGYEMQDERRELPAAKKVHEWAISHGLFIKNPFWGGGEVVDKDGRIVDPDCLPGFVQKHIEIRTPDDQEDQQ